MKILILDSDKTHNLKIESSFKGVQDTKVLFFSELDSFYEVLNGSPALQILLRDTEKTLQETEVLIQKAEATCKDLDVKATAVKDRLSKEFSIKEQQEVKPKIEKEKADLEAQLVKTKELLGKLADLKKSKLAEKERVTALVPADKESKCELVLVDTGFVGSSAGEWIKGFREKISLKDNKEVPVIAMGYSEDLKLIEKVLVPGIKDYFVKPVDLLLLKHNVAKISTGQVDSNNKLFEIESKSEIKILRKVSIKKMSEFEMTVQSRNKLEVDEFIEFFADVFNFEKGGRLMARCLKAEPDSTDKSLFLLNLSFVGLSAHQMNELRKWIKAQYINSKKTS